MIIFDFGILTATTSALIHHRTVVVDLVKALLATQRIYNWNVTIVMNAIISNWHGLRIIVVIGTRWMRWRCYIRIRIIMWIHCYWGGQLDGFYIYTRWMTKQNENQKKKTAEPNQILFERSPAAILIIVEVVSADQYIDSFANSTQPLRKRCNN